MIAPRHKEIARSVKSQAALFQAGSTAVIQSRELDDLSTAAVGWNKEYMQLRSGRFFGTVAVARTAQMQLGLISWNTAVQARGCAPRGTRSIAVPIGAHPAPCFCGVAVAGEEIVTEQEGTEVDFRGAKTCEFLVMSIGINVLQHHAVARWGEPFESRIVERRINLGSAAARVALGRSWSSLLAKVQRDPEALANPYAAHVVEQSAVNALLSVAGPPPKKALSERRQSLAQRAEEFLRSYINTPITVRDVCDWVGTSERSLHLGFLERFGMSPMAYLKVLRLNRVRRQLRDAAPGTTVTDVAMCLGFSHLGRFATEYVRFFGERPSTTLQHLAR
jgi:AraC-like DNA-binding protein